MAPTPLHGPGAQRRLARQLREAALRATPRELLDLERLERAVREGEVSIPVASDVVRELLRQQNQRTDLRQAA